jgi:hypothetical protein
MPIARRLCATVPVLLAVLAAVLGSAPVAHAEGGGSGGETISVTVPTIVTCTSGGTDVGVNPTVHPGDTLLCTVTGFGVSEKVDVTVDPGGRSLSSATTDASGKLTYTFTIPADLTAGAYTLTFTGATSKATAMFSFTVAVAGMGGGGVAPVTEGTGGLAFTGASVIGPISGALVLIGAGFVLTVGTRRRRHG